MARRKKLSFESLTWDDLENWAGSKIVSRGRSYQRNGYVKKLGKTSKGDLVAWVSGTEEYATKVSIRDGELESICTCPYWDDCKHAVAIVVEYLDYIKKEKTVPQISKKDERIELLDDPFDEDEFNEEEDDHEDELLTAFLQKHTKSQLLSLMEDLAKQFHEVNEYLRDKQQLSSGNVNKLIKAIQYDIQELSSTPGWNDHWRNDGYIPDYSKVEERMKNLLDKGYADEVLALGKELFESGTNQVEVSHDHGQTAEEIAYCLDVAFEALPKSSKSPVEQMQWAVQMELDDNYYLCEGIGTFWKIKQIKNDWSALADILIDELKQLGKQKHKDNYSLKYRRESLVDWIVHALRKAGRSAEILPICEKEARITDSYVRLVNELRRARKQEKAEEWIIKGIKATENKHLGIAHQLREIFIEIHEKKKDRPLVAAVFAEEFIYSPSLSSYKELQKASKKSKSWSAICEAVWDYLETGNIPSGKHSWPLPKTGLPPQKERAKTNFPDIETLIEIAIFEKLPDQVLHWYNERKNKNISWGMFRYKDDHIAEAIKDKYPDQAIEIWKKMSEMEIAQTKPKAYRQAANYLKKIQNLLRKLNRTKEWKEYLTKIRTENKRKRKLMEILDGLEGRRIIKSV